MTAYREKLLPSPWLYGSMVLVIPSILILLAALGQGLLGLILGIAVYLGIVFFLTHTSPEIIISDEKILIGPAWIERKYIREATAYREEDAFRQRGPELDIRAWLQFRPGIDPVVKIELDDPEDPTPYWLISTRNPEKIVEILNQSN